MDPLLNARLFTPGDRVLVALSGGTDSLCLLHMLAAARLEMGVAVTAAHVHHGMRGAEADADVSRLEAICREWEVYLQVARVDVPALARACSISVEEAGRRARYESLERLAAEAGSNVVATAHTADDQAETVLFRVLRGTGTDGLAGIPERRALSPTLPVVRPLLGVWRAELEAYAAAHGLEPLEDCTNRDLRYRRSRIRHELLPLLEEYGATVKQSLVRLARQAREESALLNEMAQDLLRRAERDRFPWQARRLDPAAIAAAPPALARRALRILTRDACGWRAEVDSRLLEEMLRVARAEARAVEIPGTPHRLALRSGSLMIEDCVAGPRGPVEVALPGTTPANDWSTIIRAEHLAGPGCLSLPPREAVVAAAALRPPLRVRSPERGDRFHPLNAPGSRLLSDLFVDRKIPVGDRAGWPVLEDEEGIAWVPGVASAHRLRVQPHTTRCWRLRLEGHGILGHSPDWTDATK